MLAFLNYTGYITSFVFTITCLGSLDEPGLPRDSLSGLVPTVATATPCLPRGGPSLIHGEQCLGLI